MKCFFSEVHIGHLIIAEYMAGLPDLDQVWLVVSPQNPLKQRATLANDFDRLHMVQLAIDDNSKLRASNIEFSLPKPSYTIDTLAFLKEKHPEHQFVLIMGGDNLGSLHLWKNYEQILAHYEIYVYQRPGYDLGELATHDFRVGPHTPGQEIAERFQREVELPGVVVCDGAATLGMISREKFLEFLSRPFGNELFMRRPITTLLAAINFPHLELPGTLGIQAAAQIALSRPVGRVYEPVVVRLADGSLRLLGIYVLLLAQSQEKDVGKRKESWFKSGFRSTHAPGFLRS